MLIANYKTFLEIFLSAKSLQKGDFYRENTVTQAFPLLKFTIHVYTLQKWRCLFLVLRNITFEMLKSTFYFTIKRAKKWFQKAKLFFIKWIDVNCLHFGHFCKFYRMIQVSNCSVELFMDNKLLNFEISNVNLICNYCRVLQKKRFHFC